MEKGARGSSFRPAGGWYGAPGSRAEWKIGGVGPTLVRRGAGQHLLARTGGALRCVDGALRCVDGALRCVDGALRCVDGALRCVVESQDETTR